MKLETKWIILGILTTGCRTGYEIKKLIDVSFSHFWKMSFGQIYPALKALVEEGYAVQATINKEGEPERKEYTITESGKKKLHEWLAVPVQETGLHKSELLVKLFFGKEMSREQAIQHVEEHERLLRLKLTVYEQIEKDIRDHPDAEFWLYTLDYGNEIAKAELSWCKKTKERIK